MPRAPLIAALVASVLVPVVLGAGLIRSSSATYDEPVHLAAGYTDLVDGRYRLNAMDHPPLAEMWAALPLLALKPSVFPSHPAWTDRRVYHYGDLFLNQNRVPARKLLDTARYWCLVTLTALLGPLVVLWAFRLEGLEAAWGAALAFAFCVPWLSNAALVTTDAMSAALFLASFSLLARSERKPAHWILAGAAGGGALAAKFNMILLPPLLLSCLLAESKTEKRRADWKLIAVAVVVAILTWMSVYRFSHIPLWFKGLHATLSRLAEGRPSYLMGSHGRDGWWYYFPVAVAVKTPLPLLLMAAAGAFLALKRRASEAAWLLLPPAGYFLAALTSKTQIGYRHVLPIYPFLCVWAGLAAAKLWRSGTAARAGAAVLAAWLAVTVARVHPHHLAYFNELAGGPANGGRWLADSNLDWGQDLPGLAAELAKRGNTPVILSYFGVDDPAAYGIRFLPLGMYGNIQRDGGASLEKGGPVLFAVSETNRAAVYFEERGVFAWLSSRTPAARPGWSIALYDLTADREARELLAKYFDGTARPGEAKTLRVH